MAVIQDLYPSRTEETPQIIERQDPVVYSETEPAKGLTPEQARFYEENGYLLIHDLFSPKEVDAFTRELRRLSSLEEVKEAEESITEPDSGAVRSVFRVHQLSRFFNKLCQDERLLNIVQYLLNDDVYIHQSRINYKPGFHGKGFYWHSDFETWHVEDGMPRMRAVSCSISLTDNSEFNGPLMLIPGSHKQFVCCVGQSPEDHYKSSLKKQEFGVPDESTMEHMVDQGGLVSAKGPAGSVLFFECNIMHGSNSNITPLPRSNVFFVYNALSNQVVEPFGDQPPRPEFLASRREIEPLTPQQAKYDTLV